MGVVLQCMGLVLQCLCVVLQYMGEVLQCISAVLQCLGANVVCSQKKFETAAMLFQPGVWHLKLRVSCSCSVL